MFDWCSVCDTVIPLKDQASEAGSPPTGETTVNPSTTTTKPVPEPPAQVNAAKNAHVAGKAAKRPAHARQHTGHAHVRATTRKATTKGAEKSHKAANASPETKLGGAGPGAVENGKAVSDDQSIPAFSDASTLNPTSRTVISQEPSPLYCSEECRLKDEAANNNLQKQLSQHPLLSQQRPSLPNLLNAYPSPPPPIPHSFGHTYARSGYPAYPYQSSSPTSPSNLPSSGVGTQASHNKRFPSDFDWDAANGNYFHRVFHPPIDQLDSQHTKFKSEEDEKEAEAMLRALLQAAEDPVPQESMPLTRSTSTTEFPGDHNTRNVNQVNGAVTADRRPVLSSNGVQDGGGPVLNSSSDSVPSLSEDGHSTTTNTTDLAHHNEISPTGGAEPLQPPAYHQHHRPAFLQMTTMGKNSTNSSKERGRRDGASSSGKLSRKSSNSIIGLTPSNLNQPTNAITTPLTGSVPKNSNLPAPRHRDHSLESEIPATTLHHGGASALDLYAVGYPLAFGTARTKSAQKLHLHAKRASHDLNGQVGSFPAKIGLNHQEYLPHGDQITPTQSLLLPSRDRDRDRITKNRAGSGGSSIGSSRSRGDDDGLLVMKKRGGARRDVTSGSRERGHQERESRPTSNHQSPTNIENDGCDSSTGLLVRSTSLVPLPISSTGSSSSSIKGQRRSFTGERDKALILHPFSSPPNHARRPSSSSHRSQSHSRNFDSGRSCKWV